MSLVSLTQARETLADALARLPELAKDLEQPKPVQRAILGAPPSIVWELALDEIYDTGLDLRPRLPLKGVTAPTGPTRALIRAAEPLSTILSPLTLDPLTVVDDQDFFTRLEAQKNLPTQVKEELRRLW